jgi:hypothetical protein
VPLLVDTDSQLNARGAGPLVTLPSLAKPDP